MHPTADIQLELRHAIGDDPRLSTILNGHLALENAIQISCVKKLAKPSAIFKNNRPNFSSKVDLLEGLFGSEIDSRVYTACRKLNDLRNDLAHNLTSQKSQKLHFNLLALSLPSMPGKQKAELESMEPRDLAELTFYIIHAIIREILVVSFAAEIEEYDTEMREWLDTTK